MDIARHFEKVGLHVVLRSTSRWINKPSSRRFAATFLFYSLQTIGGFREAMLRSDSGHSKILIGFFCVDIMYYCFAVG